MLIRYPAALLAGAVISLGCAATRPDPETGAVLVTRSIYVDPSGATRGIALERVDPAFTHAVGALARAVGDVGLYRGADRDAALRRSLLLLALALDRAPGADLGTRRAAAELRRAEATSPGAVADALGVVLRELGLMAHGPYSDASEVTVRVESLEGALASLPSGGRRAQEEALEHAVRVLTAMHTAVARGQAPR